MTTPFDLARVAQNLAREQERYRRILLKNIQPIIDISPLATQAIESISRIQTSLLQPAMKTAAEALAQSVFQPMLRFAELLEKQREVEREALTLLVPKGWLISPSLAAGAPSKILEAIKEDGIDSVEQELIRLFDPKLCEEIISDCLDRPSYKVWEPKLRRALSAHKRQEYDLAIPIWLISIEGILSGELSDEDRRFDNVFTKVRRRKGQVLREAFHPSSPWVDPLLDGLVDVLREFGRPREDSANANPVLRRHAIMHGETFDFGSEKDSIQCVLVLEVIHLYLTLREPQEAPPAA